MRFIPIRSEYLGKVEELAKILEDHGYRVDIDDTDRTLDRKIVDAEREWVPYIIVIGQKEIESGELTVRVRAEGKQVKMTINELLSRLNRETEDYPKKPIYFSRYLSKRPKYIRME